MTVIDDLKNRKETLWINPDKRAVAVRERVEGYSFAYVKGAQNRFMRFLPYIAEVFPETAAKKGVIESVLYGIPEMKAYLNEQGANLKGRLLLKDDAHLPIAGSIKARGGIHAVLKIAEMLAQKNMNMIPTEDHKVMNSPEYRELFAQYTIQVGSTGNLGLSIGRTASRMGFQTIVHMSSDAQEWKKNLLRKEGVIVKEYSGDYGEAVASGRKEAAEDPMSFFIDDENSEDLFFGYSSAAMRLHVQLYKAGIAVDKTHPLFIYLPCGVGGAPGGLTFGLHQMFGPYVHCFFAEPVDAPCFTLGMASEKYQDICVQEIGLSGKTIADGLAVGRPSALACKLMKTLMAGAFTVEDEKLSEYQKIMEEKEEIFLEPSACAGFKGVSDICRPGSPWEEYIQKQNLTEYMENATHIVWATGGGELEKFLYNKEEK